MSTELTNYMPVSRKIFSHDFWNEERVYSRFEAWLDLIREARYEEVETRKLIGNKYVKWGRGELVASLRFLAERWGWSKNKVDCFIKLLINENMITKRTAAGTAQTVLTICKYDTYNGNLKKKGQEKGQQKDTKSTTPGQRRDKTNKEEESKESKVLVEVVIGANVFDETADWQNRPFDTPDVAEKEKYSAQKEKEIQEAIASMPEWKATEPEYPAGTVPELQVALKQVAAFANWRHVMEHYKVSREQREGLFKRFYEVKEDDYLQRMPAWADVVKNFYYWVAIDQGKAKIQQLREQMLPKPKGSAVTTARNIAEERMNRYPKQA